LRSARNRADFGLPDDATLYGVLQSLWKFHPDFDPLLAGVLRRDPRGLILIVQGLSKVWDDRLMRRFQRTMPDVAARVRFVPRLSYDDFLALTAMCDVMLDPLHFGGGNTTYEALAFGVPVVTLPSGFLRGRITKALYETMGMSDCVAATTEQYVELANALGTDRQRRARIREQILELNSALFSNPAGARELEDFLEFAVARAAT